MSLNEKQATFTLLVSQWTVWCFTNGYPVIRAEAWRPPEMIDLYVRRGTGIRSSLHGLKLAEDYLRLLPGGGISWDIEDYRAPGERWKSMHPLARWGGDFTRRGSNGPDPFHVSLEHRGIK